MKYFYIFGNICSIVSLVAAIEIPYISNLLDLDKWLIVGLLGFSVIFWLIFYFKPHGSISKFYDSRIDFTGSYSDSSNNAQDIIDGDFEVDTDTWGGNVLLPPFEEKPTVNILSKVNSNCLQKPIIEIVSEDFFTVKINSSVQAGKWNYRVRGKLLKPLGKKRTISPKN